MRHGYLANISYLDAQVGKLLAALQQSGVADRTVVVFVSDHGYHLGEHTLWAKTSNFERDAHVPLIIASPQHGVPGRSSQALVELIDLFPTLAELAGIPPPAGLSGQSLVPILKNPTSPGKSAAFTQHPRPAYFDRTAKGIPDAMGYSVRTDRVRYTEWREWNTGTLLAAELYDAVNDPNETHNLIDNQHYQDEQRQARFELHRQFPVGGSVK
jgi:iduronate 2-sulfatase